MNQSCKISLVFALALVVGNTAILPEVAHADPIELPIEVIGDVGETQSVTLALSAEQSASATLLYLQANNLSYANKASVQINNGAWMPSTILLQRYISRGRLMAVSAVPSIPSS